MSKQQLSTGAFTYLVFPILLTLGIFSFVSFSYLIDDKAHGQEEQDPPIAVGFQLEYQQNCLCEWPPFSGQCYGAGQCQINANTSSIENVLCMPIGESQTDGQWEPSCGNGIIDCNEQCDPNGDFFERSYCDAFFGEQDWYNEVGKVQTCSSTCQWDTTTVYSLEDCVGYCGDGILQSAEGEQCEGDGNGTSETDQYLCESCEFTGGFCGDGIIQFELGEMCDPEAEIGEGFIGNGGGEIICQSDCTIECGESSHFEYVPQLGAGTCVSNTRACEDESFHGSGTQTWNTQTNMWNQCEAEICDEFYRIENGDCVPNQCDIFGHSGIAITGSGLSTYDPETQESGPCVNEVTCDNPQTHRVHQKVDGSFVCEPITCVGPDTQICQIQDGIGEQTRECNDEAHPPVYGPWTQECTPTICDDNYELTEGQCFPSTCLEPLEEDCLEEFDHASIAKRTRACNPGPPPVPGKWTECELIQCEQGYRIHQVIGGAVTETFICELDHCEGDENLDCTDQIPNSAIALRAGECQLEQHPPQYAYGTCELIECNPGYAVDQQTGTCVEIQYPVFGQAWSPNAGWFNMNPTVQEEGFQSAYLRVSESSSERGIMEGFAWNTNIGWVNFTGVEVNENGELEGNAVYTHDFGSGQQQFVINMNPSCGGDPVCGVRIQANGDFTGYAWDSGFGWLLFDPMEGGVETTYNLFTPPLN